MDTNNVCWFPKGNILFWRVANHYKWSCPLFCYSFLLPTQPTAVKDVCVQMWCSQMYMADVGRLNQMPKNAKFLYWILGTGSLEKRLRWQGKQVQQDVNMRQTTRTWDGNQEEQYEGIEKPSWIQLHKRHRGRTSKEAASTRAFLKNSAIRQHLPTLHASVAASAF